MSRSENRGLVIACLKGSDTSLTIKEIAERTGIGYTAAKGIIARLECARRTGRGERNDPYRYHHEEPPKILPTKRDYDQMASRLVAMGVRARSA